MQNIYIEKVKNNNMAKTTCLYSKLKGIIPNQTPTEDFLKSLTKQETCQVVNYYFPDNDGGVVSTFWGIDLLEYSKIINLDQLQEYKPKFEKREDGLIIPTLPLCNGESEAEIYSLDKQIHVAMRETLSQALSHLTGERKNRYFMITPYSGCCPFRSGKVEVSLSELEKKLKK